MISLVFVKESQRLPGKHLLDFCGEPMLKRICRILEETGHFDRVVVYSKYRDLQLDGCTVEKDNSGGALIDSILSALDSYGTFLAVGGDMPLIDGDLVRSLMESYHKKPIAATDFAGTIEPLFAVYDGSVKEGMEAFSKNTKRIFPFLQEKFDLFRVDEVSSLKLFNVNTRDELETARALAKCGRER